MKQSQLHSVELPSILPVFMDEKEKENHVNLKELHSEDSNET